MGAISFVHEIKDVSAKSCYEYLVERATYEKGHDSYSGTINTCSLGRCLKKYDKLTKTNIKNDTELIIPLRTTQEVLRLMQENIENESSTVKITPEPNQVQFSFSNIRLISRLINADYPKYVSIIPKEFENKVILNRRELIEAVRIIGLFSGKVNDVKFNFNPSKKEITLEAQDPSLGKSQTILTPLEMSGNSLEISFNYRFLLDGLNSAKGEEVFIGLNKESNPGLIKEKQDDNFVYILMPIKL